MIVPFMDSFHSQGVSSAAWIFAASLVVLSALLLLRKHRVRESSYPLYKEIPDGILTHMPSKKELAELDQKIDVIVCDTKYFF